ncbi:Ig-like domain repeat protein, partial [Edaphobacter sp.]|uniref:Ig-like domain repeat protein n=1 Tax=Edaphobacter sp. TaxID=1934404 RepID=UPI002DBAF3F0
RDVPDFALNSGALHDGYIVCSQSDCTSGFTAGGVIDVFGGTSAAAPTFAGMLALTEQKQGGVRLGNIGPKLYGLANVANVFHDIASGNNKVYCIQGTSNCSNGGPIGFSAGAGYDQATGLGSVDAANMVNNWSSAVPTGTGSTIGTTLSSTTLTASGALCGIASGSLALSVKVANSGSSSATPTGTVQFYVDGSPVSAPVLLSGGQTSYTLSTTGLASGQHNVTAVYSGDSTFAGSKGSLLANASNTGIVSPIDVVSTTSPDFSITPCTASTNVTSGATASAVVLTITPAAGFTGSVNLSANSDSGDLFGYAFSVKPVVINSSSAGTSSFVLTAKVTTTNGALKKPAAPFGSGRTPWYAAGSGATLACLIFFLVPRKRRWGALLALMLSVAAIGASGCGNNTVTAPGGGGGGGGTTTSNAQPGTYNITVTATSGNLVHSVVLTYNVQ